MAPPRQLDRFPEELVLYIFGMFDIAPPSESKSRLEPSLTLTNSAECDLKHISLVCRRWRRIVLPLLFEHARLLLTYPALPERYNCTVCDSCFGPSVCPGDVHFYHWQSMQDGRQRLEQASSASKGLEIGSAHERPTRSVLLESYKWLPRLYHRLAACLSFVAAHDLASHIKSVVVMTESMLSAKADRYPHLAASTCDLRYRAVAAFWQHLLSVIEATRVVVVAPPIDMACLASCAMDTFGDWAFGDMEYQILEICNDPTNRNLVRPDVAYESLECTPSTNPGIARDSVLNLRSWSRMRLNEGSFLKAYGTYEFFERGPPSLVHSIKSSLESISPGPHDSRFRNLRSLTYTAIFPFANHLDFVNFLHQLEELDVQLAPDPNSGILDDEERVGKAELSDCWSELCSVYQSLAIQLATSHSNLAAYPMKQFICRDSRIPALQRDLDEIFTPLCLPVWAEYETGVFKRLVRAAEIYVG